MICMIYRGRRAVGGYGGRENDFPTQPNTQQAPQQTYQNPYQPAKPNYRYLG